MDLQHRAILSIEAAIAGGSLAVLRDGAVVAEWVGTADLSRAEDLLPAIDGLLAEQQIARTDVGLVAVSAGPGSFTGIRIGLATALGIKAGLDIPLASASALEALAFMYIGTRPVSVCLPVGREAVCIQSFERAGDRVTPLDEPRTIRESDALSFVAAAPTMFVLHHSLYSRIDQPQAIDAGANIASAVGQYCSRFPAMMSEPLFVSKSF